MTRIITLKKNYQFQTVFNQGKSYATKFLVVFIRENSLDYNRVGFCVGKKVGNSVQRNRVKRLIKEVFRIYNPYLHQGFDLVFIGRHRASEMSYQQCKKDFLTLIKKSKILPRDMVNMI